MKSCTTVQMTRLMPVRGSVSPIKNRTPMPRVLWCCGPCVVWRGIPRIYRHIRRDS
jgi:hypothetical protein